jgi:hypothetical protein
MRALISRKAAFAMETFRGIIVISATLVLEEIGGVPLPAEFSARVER